MIKVEIPTLRDKPELGPLRVTMTIGSNGFKRSDVYKKWAPNQSIYVDPETTSIEYSIIGHEKSSLKVRIK